VQTRMRNQRQGAETDALSPDRCVRRNKSEASWPRRVGTSLIFDPSPLMGVSTRPARSHCEGRAQAWVTAPRLLGVLGAGDARTMQHHDVVGGGLGEPVSLAPLHRVQVQRLCPLVHRHVHSLRTGQMRNS
jgi:hypothetical protein